MESMSSYEVMNGHMPSADDKIDFRSLHDCRSSAIETNTSFQLPGIKTICKSVERSQNFEFAIATQSQHPPVQKDYTFHTDKPEINFGAGGITDVPFNTWPVFSSSLNGTSGSIAASNNPTTKMGEELNKSKVQSCGAMWVPLNPVMPKCVGFASSSDSESSYYGYRDSLTVLAHSQQLIKDATRKREMRLLKNRVAAKRCRQRKREYVNCLEARLSLLKQQNEQLVEEVKLLRASVLLDSVRQGTGR